MASEAIDSRASLNVMDAIAARQGARSSSIVRDRAVRILILGAWFGLLTGFAEVFLLAARKFVLLRFVGDFVGFNPHVVWMAPLADLILFSLAGFALLGGFALRPKLISLHTAGVVFAFLTFVSLLLSIQRLQLYAVLLLATGLAAVCGRLIRKHGPGFDAPIFWRTTKLMLALVAALLIGVHSWQWLAERRSLAALPAAPPNAPNVLLITLDTVRAQSLSLYGYSRPTTPQLERIGKSGVRFDRALVTAPWTLPSHASMFTGRSAGEMSTDWFKPLDAAYPTLAEVLGKHGYATAGFVGNLYYCNSATGLDRGFVHYEEYPISIGQIILSSKLNELIFNSCVRRLVDYQEDLNRKSAALLNNDFLNWLSRNDQRPFFAFVNYFDAHEPFLPPAPFAEEFGPRGRPKNNTNMAPATDWAEQDIRLERDAYDGSIAYLDQQLGLLFDELQRRGKLENTLVIITSDHGEEFAEHQIMGHGYDLYMPSLHVPLLILLPSRVPAGTTIKETVTLRDLPATVMGLLKLQDAAQFSGNSLARYWDGTRNTNAGTADMLLSELKFTPNLPASYPVSRGDMKSLTSGPYHYIKNGDGSEELYNFENDPDETKDLSRSEKERQVFDRFRVSLKTTFSRE